MASSHITTPKLHVGVYQGGYAEGVEANLKLLENVIEQKRDQQLDLIIFCELFLCGYCIGPKFNEVAEVANGSSFQFISSVAKKNNIGIAYGYAERYKENSTVVYNSVQIIDKEGKSILNYRKTHVWGPYENDFFTKGDVLPPVVDFCGMKVSALICYDIEFVEPARILAINGAQLLIVPTAIVTMEMSRLTIPCRAYENNVFICYANRVGLEPCAHWNRDLKFIGNSVIYAPDGTELARGNEAKEELLVAEIDFSRNSYAQKNAQNPYFVDRRPELYEQILKK
jgi:predicted amidohydrolase